MNLETLNSVPSKVCSFATFVVADMLPLTPLSAVPPTCTVNTVIYSYNCLMMAG